MGTKLDNNPERGAAVGIPPIGVAKPGTLEGNFDKEFGLDVVTKKPSLLDSVLYALTGNPDDVLTPQQRQQKQKKRAQAGDLAQRAASADFESYMGPQSGGGGGFNLGSVISAIGKMF